MRTHRVTAPGSAMAELGKVVRARRDFFQESLDAGLEAAEKKLKQGGIEIMDMVSLSDVIKVKAPRPLLDESLSVGAETTISRLEKNGVSVPPAKVPFDPDTRPDKRVEKLAAWIQSEDAVLANAQRLLDRPCESVEALRHSYNVKRIVFATACMVAAGALIAPEIAPALANAVGLNNPFVLPVGLGMLPLAQFVSDRLAQNKKSLGLLEKIERGDNHAHSSSGSGFSGN